MEKVSIFDNFALDLEIWADQCMVSKGAMYKFWSVMGTNDPFLIGFGPPNFRGAKSGWFGAFSGEMSIFSNFGLDQEIWADQCTVSIGAMYKFWSVMGPNDPFLIGFGPPNFPGAKSG